MKKLTLTLVIIVSAFMSIHAAAEMRYMLKESTLGCSDWKIFERVRELSKQGDLKRGVALAQIGGCQLLSPGTMFLTRDMQNHAFLIQPTGSAVSYWIAYDTPTTFAD